MNYDITPIAPRCLLAVENIGHNRRIYIAGSARTTMRECAAVETEAQARELVHQLILILADWPKGA